MPSSCRIMPFARKSSPVLSVGETEKPPAEAPDSAAGTPTEGSVLAAMSVPVRKLAS